MKRPSAPPLRMIGYVRVSTEEQGISGAGLESQRQAIEEECRRKGWTLVEIVEDVASGRSLVRAGLDKALDRLRRHEVDGLVVAKLDRLSRSVQDFAGLLANFQKQGWHLRMLDPDVDTTSPSGRLLAHITSAVAEWERAMIGQRTASALAVKRAQGVRLGRPPLATEAVRERIFQLRRRGKGWSAIARTLDSESLPPPRGGERWQPSTVQRLVRAHAPRLGGDRRPGHRNVYMATRISAS